MALGKELMADHWCMQCTSSKAQFLDGVMLWEMDNLIRLGKEAEKKGRTTTWNQTTAMVAIHTCF
jgi:hypothetical protein